MNKGLRERRKELIKKIPPLDGVIRATIRETYAPCGKANCKCKRGYLHGPYYYLAVTTKRKTMVYYLPSRELGKKAKRGIESYNKLWNLLCKISEINIKILKEEKK